MPLSVSLWNDLGDPVFDGVGLAGLIGGQCFPVGMICSFLPSMGWLCGVGVFGLIECPYSLPALHSGLQNNNNNTELTELIISIRVFPCQVPAG